MNKYAIDWAIGSSDLKNKEKSILQFLFKCSNDAGKCFPCVNTITKQTSMSESSYKYAIKNLIIMGLVKREFRYSGITGQQRSNYFYLAKEFYTLTKENITLFINKAVKAFYKQKEQNSKSTKTTNQREQNNINRKEILGKLKAVSIHFNKNLAIYKQALKRQFLRLNSNQHKSSSLETTLNTYNLAMGGQKLTTYTSTLYSLKKKKYIPSKDV